MIASTTEVVGLMRSMEQTQIWIAASTATSVADSIYRLTQSYVTVAFTESAFSAARRIARLIVMFLIDTTPAKQTV
jgi:hypothetical protein